MHSIRTQKLLVHLSDEKMSSSLVADLPQTEQAEPHRLPPFPSIYRHTSQAVTPFLEEMYIVMESSDMFGSSLHRGLRHQDS
jgi:hypothetical protein